ncbi:MAG TPA: hypothetical protein VHW23_43215 [Kofleriaceae bacterium]|jgi:hypothetical protein|nr:hypothetical protein [Kofleriaceae bacterium]
MTGIGSNTRVEIALAIGVLDAQGKRARTAVLTPATGYGELAGAEEPNPFRAALALLSQCVQELGPFRGPEIDMALLGQLLAVDRDYLLVHLNRLTFGDVRYQTVHCPQASCGHRLDVRFALSGAELPELAPSVATEAGGTLELPGGRVVRFRLPRAADQVELHGVPPPDLEAAFLRRCVRDGGDEGRQVRCAELMAMPAQVRADVVRRIVAASPEMDLAVPLACVECGRPFRFVFDPVRALLAELKASRGELLRQVHRLARSYHWSQSEILGLPRSLRHEYLELVQEEAGR